MRKQALASDSLIHLLSNSSQMALTVTFFFVPLAIYIYNMESLQECASCIELQFLINCCFLGLRKIK